MPHCDPAPPHPEPGTVYATICPPTVEEAVIALGLVAVILIMSRYIGRDTRHDPDGGDE